MVNNLLGPACCDGIWLCLCSRNLAFDLAVGSTRVFPAPTFPPYFCARCDDGSYVGVSAEITRTNSDTYAITLSRICPPPQGVATSATQIFTGVSGPSVCVTHNIQLGNDSIEVSLGTSEEACSCGGTPLCPDTGTTILDNYSDDFSGPLDQSPYGGYGMPGQWWYEDLSSGAMGWHNVNGRLQLIGDSGSGRIGRQQRLDSGGGFANVFTTGLEMFFDVPLNVLYGHGLGIRLGPQSGLHFHIQARGDFLSGGSPDYIFRTARIGGGITDHVINQTPVSGDHVEVVGEVLSDTELQFECYINSSLRAVAVSPFNASVFCWIRVEINSGGHSSPSSFDNFYWTTRRV